MYAIPSEAGGSIQISGLQTAGLVPTETSTDYQDGDMPANMMYTVMDSTQAAAHGGLSVFPAAEAYDTVVKDGEGEGYLDVIGSSASVQDSVTAARAEVLCFHPVDREECELKLNQAVLGGGSYYMTRAKASNTVLSYIIEKPEAARYVNIEGAIERGVQHSKIVKNASDGSYEITRSGKQLTLGLTLPSAVTKLVEMLEVRFACKVSGLKATKTPEAIQPATPQENGDVGADVIYYPRADVATSASTEAPPVAGTETAPSVPRKKKSRPLPIAFSDEASVENAPVKHVEAAVRTPTTPAGGLDMTIPTTPAGGRDMEEVRPCARIDRVSGMSSAGFTRG